MSPKYWECDNCDGYGTYEGGKDFMFTTCQKCKGYGVLQTNGMKPLEKDQIAEVQALQAQREDIVY